MTKVLVVSQGKNRGKVLLSTWKEDVQKNDFLQRRSKGRFYVYVVEEILQSLDYALNNRCVCLCQPLFECDDDRPRHRPFKMGKGLPTDEGERQYVDQNIQVGTLIPHHDEVRLSAVIK